MGKKNVTIEGNATINGAVDTGAHNITVYAEDEFGNVGFSETIDFTVKTPFVATFMVGVIAVPVAIVCLIIGMILNRRQSENR